jgi:hypothetical protein
MWKESSSSFFLFWFFFLSLGGCEFVEKIQGRQFLRRSHTVNKRNLGLRLEPPTA